MQASNTSSTTSQDDLSRQSSELSAQLQSLEIKSNRTSVNTIDDILDKQSDSEFQFRALLRDDYERGIMDVLG